MWKKMLCMALVLGLLLCGCGEKPTGDSQPTDAESTSASGGPVDYLQNVKDLAEVIPAYEKEPLVEYDPDRQVYISLENQDCDFYPNNSNSGGTVFILTREHYDVSQIQFNIPSQTQYEVSIRDLTPYCTVAYYNSEQSNHGLWDYQYIALQGMSWHEIVQMEAEARAAKTLAQQNTSDIEAHQAYRAISDAYYQMMENYETQYENLPQEQIPQFSAYALSYRFTDLGSHEETVETVEFRIGEETYTRDIGQWRLHETLPQELEDGKKQPVGLTIKNSGRFLGGVPGTPYTNGYIQLGSFFTFDTQEDLTLTGVHQVGVEVGLLGARVRIDGAQDYFWDLQRPLELEAGAHVEIDLFVKDARLAQYEIFLTTNFVLDYQIKNKTYGMVKAWFANYFHSRVWDTYLMAFEGIDIGEYYTCYYERTNSEWIQELPEEWLK